MRTTVGFVLSLVFAVGTFMFLLESHSSRRRMDSINAIQNTSPTFLRRKLWNYSGWTSKRNGSSGSSSSSSNGYNKYSSNSNSGSSSYNNGMNPNYSSNSAYSSNSGSSSSSSSSSSQYGNNYANYNDNSNNNSGNYNNQNYENSNYIWQRDDDDNYKNDDTSYYNSNSNYKANGGSYNGRDQYWGGQRVQNYDDDTGPQVYVEGMDDDDESWKIFSKLGNLSAKETAAVSILAALFSLCLLFLLGVGCSMVDICQLYCCCGILRHDGRDMSTVDGDNQHPIVDGFVKLGDF
ncbi:hypothetical protein IV203_028709 [Nitzschia inconspicua]|uniref:Uncharacterized protein n=1 Tax=Nitzschia inconspicua TaxID=303405 RepID=A0A9K3LQF9_9STRA|nr:hypothetical protein IV203_028709 [Nitzschia inconspicua]